MEAGSCKDALAWAESNTNTLMLIELRVLWAQYIRALLKEMKELALYGGNGRCGSRSRSRVSRGLLPPILQ